MFNVFHVEKSIKVSEKFVIKAIDKHFQTYAEIVFCFGLLATDNFLQPRFIQKDFIASIEYLDGSLQLDSFGFDIRH